MLISACTSCSGRSRGSSTASGLECASHCIRRFTRAHEQQLEFFTKAAMVGHEQGLITVIQDETKRTEEKEEAGYRSPNTTSTAKDQQSQET